MKKTVKFLCILLIAVMMLAFVSCDSLFERKVHVLTEEANVGDGEYKAPSNSTSGVSNDNNQVMDSSLQNPDSGANKDMGIIGGDAMESGVVLEEAPNVSGETPNFAPDAAPDSEYPVEKPELPKSDFISTKDQNVSTFSADVDTASYTYFRKLVNSGYKLNDLLYSGSAFRSEEFINYFDYSATAPKEGELFGVASSIIACPWNSESFLLSLTLQAEQAQDCIGNNLVFLIDVSGSMRSQDKLPLLQKTFKYLVENLDENDRVSIVTYSGRESVVLDGCAGNKGEAITKAINGLVASGSTNGEAGLSKAYAIAEKNYIEGGNNRIIMASDGDLNVGISSAEQLKQYISGKRDQGIYLSVLGFGMGNYRDENMEALADNGNGMYYYVDGDSEAERIFGTKLLGTLYTVAEDVKLQVTFDSELVSAYRLIGYKNRILDKEDFDNDRKDAGEVGSGHQVTVCYEIKLCEDVQISERELLTLAVRYKNPGETISRLNNYNIGGEAYLETADEDMIFKTCLIQTCMILNKSADAENMSINGVLETLETLDLSEYPERAEFRELIKSLAK